MSGVPPANVLRLYDQGVDAFADAAGRQDPGAWALAACGAWTAADLARHVLAVAGWFHDWLDRAERGDAEPPFGAADLTSRNAEALAALTALEGPTALARFVERARTYRNRLPDRWDLPYGYPRGTVTAGLHAAVAACEWHLHTWDLAHAQGRGHRPSDPAALYAATGVCLAVAEGGLRGRVAALLVPLGTRLRPWEAILRRSGRAPGPHD
jgi:Mycothiol maleylpyruvate isomerase N-terminal domain